MVVLAGMWMKRLRLAHIAIVAALLAAAPALHAEDRYPSRPIRMIVSFPPGGGVDVVARLFADRMGKLLGEPLVVENKGGASGIIAGRQVSQADPDGYTILIATNSMMVAQLMTANSNLDMLRDLKAVASIAPQANIIVASPGLDVKSLADVIALAKTRHLTYASPGAGSVPQLFVEHFLASVAKAPMTHVPFQGAAAALTATMAGQTDIAVVTLPPAVEFVNAGKLKGIAVTTPARSAALPQIPTVAESGYTGISSTVWAAIFVPAKTPDAVARRLSETALKVAAMPDVQDRLRRLGYETTAVPGEQFQQDIAKELRVWAEIVAGMNAKH
jgi:tripartite-type tricarboxylate transporter receptor subunit TctC